MTSAAPESEEVLALVHALRCFPKHGFMQPDQLRMATGVNMTGRADLLTALDEHPRVEKVGLGYAYRPIVPDVHSSGDLMKRLRDVSAGALVVTMVPHCCHVSF